MSTTKYLPSKIAFQDQHCVFFVRPWSRSDILFLSVLTKPMMAYKSVLPKNITSFDVRCFFLEERRRNIDGGAKNIYYSILIPKSENMFLLCLCRDTKTGIRPLVFPKGGWYSLSLRYGLSFFSIFVSSGAWNFDVVSLFSRTDCMIYNLARISFIDGGFWGLRKYDVEQDGVHLSSFFC